MACCASRLAEGRSALPSLALHSEHEWIVYTLASQALCIRTMLEQQFDHLLHMRSVLNLSQRMDRKRQRAEPVAEAPFEIPAGKVG